MEKINTWLKIKTWFKSYIENIKAEVNKETEIKKAFKSAVFLTGLAPASAMFVYLKFIDAPSRILFSTSALVFAFTLVLLFVVFKNKQKKPE